MINFKKVELKDKVWAEPLIVAADKGGCHQNFTNIYAWSEIFQYRVAQVADHVVVKGFYEGQDYYFYPAGHGDVKKVLEEMKQDAIDCGHEFIMFGVSPEDRQILDELYPERFEYKAMRDSYDYVYLLEKLVTLKGNKLHSKRNHINRFKKNFTDWNFERITEENIGECWEMNLKWCELHGSDDRIADESCAVRRCFEHFSELGLEGGLIRLEGKVIAYTMGERLNSNTYVIHIEKAFSDIPGAYQMINREFAANVQERYPDIVYMNREEDMGLEGLRKAKLSYYPDKMEEKLVASYL